MGAAILPAVREIDSVEALPALEAGNIDLAFARLDGDLGPTVQSLPLREDRLMVALPSHHALAARTRTSLSSLASALYSASLRHKVRAGAVRGIFQSMVELSDNADLMGKFLGLPCPKLFMYGEQNAGLSYLPHIQAHGVRLAPIVECGRFPMYSNPGAMWQQIADFLRT